MNLKSVTIAVTTAVALGAASVASAEQITYLSLGLGFDPLANMVYNNLKSNSLYPISGDSFFGKFKNNAAYNVSTGHLWSVGNSMAYGVEIGFSAYPTLSATNLKNKADATTIPYVEGMLGAKSVDLFAVGKYSLSPKFNVNAKLGESYLMRNATGKVHMVIDILKHTMDLSELVPAASVGIGYKITNNFTINLDARFAYIGLEDSTLDAKAIKDPKAIAKAFANAFLPHGVDAILASMTYSF